MFYNIKIKSNKGEYSLDSFDKDIIQREMDLYFASLYGASPEFRSKIKEIDVTQKNRETCANLQQLNYVRENIVNNSPVFDNSNLGMPQPVPAQPVDIANPNFNPQANIQSPLGFNQGANPDFGFQQEQNFNTAQQINAVNPQNIAPEPSSFNFNNETANAQPITNDAQFLSNPQAQPLPQNPVFNQQEMAQNNPIFAQQPEMQQIPQESELHELNPVFEAQQMQPQPELQTPPFQPAGAQIPPQQPMDTIQPQGITSEQNPPQPQQQESYSGPLENLINEINVQQQEPAGENNVNIIFNDPETPASGIQIPPNHPDIQEMNTIMPDIQLEGVQNIMPSSPEAPQASELNPAEPSLMTSALNMSLGEAQQQTANPVFNPEIPSFTPVQPEQPQPAGQNSLLNNVLNSIEADNSASNNTLNAVSEATPPQQFQQNTKFQQFDSINAQPFQPEMQPQIQPQPMQPQFEPQTFEPQTNVQPEQPQPQPFGEQPQIEPQFQPQQGFQSQFQPEPLAQQPQPQAFEQPQTQSFEQPQPQAFEQAQPQPQLQTEIQNGLQTEFQPIVESQFQPEMQPQIQPQIQPEMQPQTQAQIQPQPQLQSQPQPEPVMQQPQTEILPGDVPPIQPQQDFQQQVQLQPQAGPQPELQPVNPSGQAPAPEINNDFNLDNLKTDLFEKPAEPKVVDYFEPQQQPQAPQEPFASQNPAPTAEIPQQAQNIPPAPQPQVNPTPTAADDSGFEDSMTQSVLDEIKGRVDSLDLTNEDIDGDLLGVFDDDAPVIEFSRERIASVKKEYEATPNIVEFGSKYENKYELQNNVPQTAEPAPAEAEIKEEESNIIDLNLNSTVNVEPLPTETQQAPQPVPQPAPQPEQQPLPQPVPQQTPEQAPQPVPQPTLQTEPQPIAQPQPVQEPQPQITQPAPEQKPLEAQTQEHSEPAVDFKTYYMGFDCDLLVDKFLICAYYIKNILHEESFTLKSINSKLFTASGEIANMNTIEELVSANYLIALPSDNVKQFAISPAGEEYFTINIQK